MRRTSGLPILLLIGSLAASLGSAAPAQSFRNPTVLAQAAGSPSRWITPSTAPLDAIFDRSVTIVHLGRLPGDPSSRPHVVTLPPSSSAAEGPSDTPGDALAAPRWNAAEAEPDWGDRLAAGISIVCQDHAEFYGLDHVPEALLAVGIGAILANTSADESIRDEYQDDVRSRVTDRWATVAKTLGEGKYVLPGLAVAWLADRLVLQHLCDSPLGDWSDGCLRAVLVGGVPMAFWQRAFGGSRPGEVDHDSRWAPFRDANGVSGHSFIGAVPFLVAAEMCDEWWWKALFFAGSTCAGWSRVNDDAHYFSQVMLGWWLAYSASRAVVATNERAEEGYRFVPLMLPDGTGMSVEFTR